MRGFRGLFIFCFFVRCIEAKPLFGKQHVNVSELTPLLFETEVLNSSQTWAIDFYANWCPHCIVFAPVWSDVGGRFRLRQDHRIKVGAMDCAEPDHREFCSKVGIHAYPTLRMYNVRLADGSQNKDPVVLTVQGKRTADNLVKGITAELKYAGPAPDSIGPAPNSPKAKTSADSSNSRVFSTDVVADRRSSQQRLADAEVALVFALRQGVATAAARSNSSPSALTGEPLHELGKWLGLLSQLLPRSTSRQDVKTLQIFVENAHKSSSAVLPVDMWNNELDKRSIGLASPQAGGDPLPFFHLCKTYTCGLWSLFHVLTVSSASANRHQMRLRGDASPSPTPGETLLRIRKFVEHFFGCEDCSKHFQDAYDNCAFGRCDLSADDGIGSALWLWRQHNSVTNRVAKDLGVQTAPDAWPQKSFCPECWNNSPSEAVPEKVYRYLELAYYPRVDVSTGTETIEATPAIPALAIPFLLGGVCWLYLLCKAKGKGALHLKRWAEGKRFILNPCLQRWITFTTV